MSIPSARAIWFFVFPIILVSFVTNLRSVPYDLFSHAGDAKHSSRVLLLTAHPDDECMFFAPTLLALTSDPNVEVFSLCLSNGDADGLGGVRQLEFEQSLEVLGVPAGQRWVLDKPKLQDNFTAEWDTQVIADVVRPYIFEHRISAILTFDHEGVSSHPNHRSLPKGAAHLISSLDPTANAPRLFSLTTVPLHLKYLSALPSRLTIASELVRLQLESLLFLTGFKNVETEDESTTTALFISGFQQYRTGLSAMLKHKSQLVWFRWLYVAFSHYMWANEWVEIIPPHSTSSSPAAEVV